MEYMEKTGSFAYCKKVVRELVEKALVMVKDLDEGGDEGELVRAIVCRFPLD